VLEKHGDFLRDFRGDTIHPSTLELMRELGFLDDFLRLPHPVSYTHLDVYKRQVVRTPRLARTEATSIPIKPDPITTARFPRLI